MPTITQRDVFEGLTYQEWIDIGETLVQTWAADNSFGDDDDATMDVAAERMVKAIGAYVAEILGTDFDLVRATMDGLTMREARPKRVPLKPLTNLAERVLEAMERQKKETA